MQHMICIKHADLIDMVCDQRDRHNALYKPLYIVMRSARSTALDFASSPKV